MSTPETTHEYRCLTTTPSSDDNFCSALENATLEDLNEALDERGRTRSKTAFNAIRSEIKRRYKETGFTSELPEFDSYTPEAIAAATDREARAFLSCDHHELAAKLSACTNREYVTSLLAYLTPGPSGHRTIIEARLTQLSDSAPALLEREAPSEHQDAEMGAQLTAQYHKAVGAMPEILRFGAMMIHLRDHIVSTMETIGDKQLAAFNALGGSATKDTGIKGWLERNAPEVKLSTAYRFEDVTKAIATEYIALVGAKVAKQYTLPDLVTAEPAKLDEPARRKQQALFDYVSGTSQKSWLDKLRPQKPKGGKRTPSGPGPEEMTPEEVAIDLWKPIIGDLEREHFEKSWANLPDKGKVSRESLLGLFTDLSAAIRAAAAPAQPKRKGIRK